MQPDALTSRTRMRRKVTSTMTRRTSKIINPSRTKVRKHVLWPKTLMILIVVKIKLFKKMNLIMMKKKMRWH